MPALAVFEKDSAHVVYVLKKKNFIPVKVETGTSGGSYTIITGGLRGDEIIALSEPPSRLIVLEKKNLERSDSIKINKQR